MITLCAWGNGIPWTPSPAAPLAGTDRSSRGASPHALSSCHLRSGVNGAETRRPHNPHRAQRPLRARSTKAGAETPATRHLRTDRVVGHARSTKAGAETPATLVAHHLMDGTEARSTKAGAETPATPPRSGPCAGATGSLNEGRGRDPGDTATGINFTAALFNAQRRPGPRPWRHPAFLYASACAVSAQRRPGPRPRRHHVLEGGGRSGIARSTKAGAETPATRDDRLTASGGQHRSTKAGAETPATRPPDRNLTTGSAVFGCGCRHKPAAVLEICDESQL